MLTATYTLVALSVEQASMRIGLQAFQRYVRSTLVQQNRISLEQLKYARATLDQLYQACLWRKTEMYLIPAIRTVTEGADQLLDELSRLNQSALAVIRALQQRIADGDDGVGVGADVGADVGDDVRVDLGDDVRVDLGVDLGVDVGDDVGVAGSDDGSESSDGGDGTSAGMAVAPICAGLESFCASLLQRLDREEQELFAVARRVIGGEAWFAMAHQFMAHDARAEEARRTRPTAVAAAHLRPRHAGAR